MKIILFFFCAFLLFTVTVSVISNPRIVGKFDNNYVDTVIVGQTYRMVWEFQGSSTDLVVASFNNIDVATVMMSQLEVFFEIPPMEPQNSVSSYLRTTSSGITIYTYSAYPRQ